MARKREKKRDTSVIERTEEALELPKGVFAAVPYIECMGNREIAVEGIKGVLEYDEDMVRLNGGKMMIRILGRGLNIKCYTPQSVVVEGTVLTIDFVY